MGMENNHKYSLGEEIASSIVHGIAALLSIAGMIVLIVLAAIYSTPWHIVGYSIFGSSLIILYFGSTFYHSLAFTPARKVFRIIDHSSIFLLIAGTYTPFILISLRSPLGWFIFAIIWAIAATGITLKCIFISKFHKFYVALYIIMGWLCVIAMKQLLENLSRPSIIFLAAGGIAYTTGVSFYAIKKIPYSHFIWHLFVFTGSLCHYFALVYTL